MPVRSGAVDLGLIGRSDRSSEVVEVAIAVGLERSVALELCLGIGPERFEQPIDRRLGSGDLAQQRFGDE